MQIKHIKSIKRASEYFQEILQTDGKYIFCSTKTKVFIIDGHKIMSFPIKKSYDCLFIDEFAYIVNEDGNIFHINLETQKCTILEKTFGIDCELYKVFDNKLLVSATYNEFYRKAYIIEHTEIKELNCEPEYCMDIFGLGGQIYFVSTNSFKNRNYELSIYNYNENNNLILLYKELKASTLTGYCFEPNNQFIAYKTRKKVIIFDFCNTLIKKLKIPETVFDINWIDKGKYLFISVRKGFYIYDGKSFSLIKKFEFSKETLFLDVKISYDNNYLCVITQNETTLFALL